MARTDKQQRVCTTEDRIAMTNEADDSFRHIAKRTNNPHIIEEVQRGRSYLARLWDSLVDERQALQKGESDGPKNH